MVVLAVSSRKQVFIGDFDSVSVLKKETMPMGDLSFLPTFR
jgi:hypothetical protein